jgi:gliding motility-associated protein GldL
MGLNNIVRSRGFKNFMSKLYGWGAAVVILGALFKINHYPGAEYMLIVGLGTESLIFFFSAFEPPHVEPDWSLVYPELAGMYHGVNVELMEGVERKSGGLTGDLDKMLNEAQIGPDLIASLGTGLKSLSENTSKLKDVTDAAFATNEFTEKVKDASQSIKTLSELYNKQSDSINKEIHVSEEFTSSVKGASEKVSGLSDVYSKASRNLENDLEATSGFSESVKAATNSANKLVENYNRSSEILAASTKALDFTALNENTYNDQLTKISQNLASLNTAYELQLKNAELQASSTDRLQQTLEKFVNNLNSSADNTSKYQENLSALNNAFKDQLVGATGQAESVVKLKDTLDELLNKLSDSTDKTLKYNQELESLSKKVAALNNVYGNMLSAMNVKAEG